MRHRLLKPEEIDHHVRRVLGHRLTVILAAGETLRRNSKAFKENKALFQAVIEGTIIFQRGFVEFFGLRSKDNGTALDTRRRSDNGVRPTDLMLDNFDLPLLEPGSFSADDQKLLACIHHGASKTTAHFTFDSPHNLTIAEVGPASAVISSALIKHFYIPLGRQVSVAPEVRSHFE